MQQAGDLEQLSREAVADLQSGRYAEAARKFSAVLARDPRRIAMAVGLAYACRGTGDRAGQEKAVEHVLGLDARNLHALIMKGDLLFERGERQTASKWYSTATRLAASLPDLPEQLAGEIKRIEAVQADLAREYETRIHAQLKAAGFGSLDPAGRFSRSLEIILGRAGIYVQQPRFYYFPDLPQIEFYDRLDFDWARALEAETGTIREELQALRAGGDSFQPYLEARSNAPVKDHPMVGNADWGAFYLWRDGEPVEDNLALFPKTRAALQPVPFAKVEGMSPNVLFSRLRPGAAIPPHNGFVNTRLICHLPLIVPEGCGFRVGSQTRPWVEGELMVFDDSIEHEAWNRSDRERVVLLFEIWRPELSEEERALVAALLAAIRPEGEMVG